MLATPYMPVFIEKMLAIPYVPVFIKKMLATAKKTQSKIVAQLIYAEMPILSVCICLQPFPCGSRFQQIQQKQLDVQRKINKFNHNYKYVGL